jgi:hypothetical protein
MSLNQSCVFIEKFIEAQTSNSCHWTGLGVYRQNVINDAVNKMCIVFVCLLYLVCILYSVFRKH